MLFKNAHIRWQADTGAGGGAAGAEAGAETPAKTGDGTGGQDESPAGDAGEKQPTFTQDQLEKIIADRLERERKKAEKEAEKVKREATEQALAEQQKFQELAQARQARLLELEPALAAAESELATTQERLKRYETALTGYRDALLPAVPEHVQTLLKGMDVAEQLTWLSENAEKFATDKQQLPGFRLPQTPRPAGENGQMSDEERRRKAYRPTL